MLLFGHHTIASLVASIIVLLFGMGIHEFAHAWTANYWGDPTPRENGKLTLNPFAHISWAGWLMILVIGFGTVGSVAINPARMRDPRWGAFWMALAGPVSNLLQAVVFGILFRLLGDTTTVYLLFGMEPWDLAAAGGPNALLGFLNLLLYLGVWFNVMLFLFNMLPLFPLDGYRVVMGLLPGYWLSSKQIPAFIRQNMPPLYRFLQQPAYVWRDWQQATTYVLMGLLLLSFAATSMNLRQLNLLGLLLNGPGGWLRLLLAGIP
jgi:Zn-dependent protease